MNALRTCLTLLATALLVVLSTTTAAAAGVELQKTDTAPSPTLGDTAKRLYLSSTPRPMVEGLPFPEAGTCSVTPMSCDRTVSGSLGSGDCTLDSDGTYVDIWTFSGTAGQLVTITMRSSAFDSYLALVDPNGTLVAQDNNSAGGLDARITYTLNASGTWGIIANQFNVASGSYTLSLQCETGGGGDCTPQVRSTSCGQTVSGTIDGSDCDVEGLLVEFWTFTGTAGQTFTAAMTRTGGSSGIGLVVFHDDGTELGDDLSGGSTATVSGTLPKSGTWVVATLASGSVSYSLATACQAQSGCVPSSGNLCLNGNRFRVAVSAKDPRTGKTGTGLAVPYNSANGFFALPALTGDSANFEVFVKVLDGRPVNGRWWVFFGGLTDFEYTVAVTDTVTGQSKTYTKPGLQYIGGADTSAF